MAAAVYTEAGARFGRWVTLGRGHGRSRVMCRCDCGSEKPVLVANLRSGGSESCGCVYERHGHATGGQSRTYKSWAAMRSRCTSPTTPDYAQYGGRGITVCGQWSDFAMFLADMGERPPGTSLDRIDNSKGYEPGNCRWATAKEQAGNRRSPKLEPHEPAQIFWLVDAGYSAAEIAAFFGISKSRVWGLGKEGRNASK